MEAGNFTFVVLFVSVSEIYENHAEAGGGGLLANII